VTNKNKTKLIKQHDDVIIMFHDDVRVRARYILKRGFVNFTSLLNSYENAKIDR